MIRFFDICKIDSKLFIKYLVYNSESIMLYNIFVTETKGCLYRLRLYPKNLIRLRPA